MEATKLENKIVALSEQQIRELVAKVLKHSLKSRAQIADELTALTGRPVTKRMLDDWCSPSRKSLRFPLSLAGPLCHVTGSDKLAEAVMGEHLRKRVELGTRVIELHSLASKVAEQAGILARQNRPSRKRKRSK